MPDSAPPARQVRVIFRKAVSDGNYGTESAEVMFEEWTDDPDDADTDNAIAEAMLQDARALVHAELAHSPNARVRAALQLPLPPGLSTPNSDQDDLPL